MLVMSLALRPCISPFCESFMQIVVTAMLIMYMKIQNVHPGLFVQLHCDQQVTLFVC